MKRIFLVLVLVLVMIAPVTPVHSADQDGGYTILGYGTVSCGRWKEARLGDYADPAKGWIQGYLTGFNAFNSNADNVSKGTDAPGLFGWVDLYCKEHPLRSMADAANDLIRYLEAR